MVLRFSISFGFENSLPLSVRITGNKLLNVFAPRTSSNKFMISITEADVLRPAKSQHETAFYKVYGKKTFSSHTTNHAIHLYNGRFRVCSQIFLKVSVASFNTAAPVNFKFRLLITGTVFHFTGQINIPDIKELGIHVVIQCLFTAHQFIYMSKIDLMKRLPVLTKGLMIPLILAISSSLDMIPVLASETA